MRYSGFLPLCAFSVLLVAGSCSRRPSGVLSDDKMTDVMVDLKLAESYCSYYPGSPSDSLASRLSADVLRRHGVSREDFEKTLVWYGRNFDDYVELYDRMERRLASRQKDYIADAVSAGGKDLWPYPRHLSVSALASTDGFTFSVAPGELKPGEALQWIMRLDHVADGKMLIGVDYEGGQTDYMVQSVGGGRRVEMTMPTDTALMPKRVYGTFHTDSRFMPIWIDSIALSHRRMSPEERNQSRQPRRYVLPGKYDPRKARERARMDSLRKQAQSPSGVETVGNGVSTEAEYMDAPRFGHPGQERTSINRSRK